MVRQSEAAMNLKSGKPDPQRSRAWMQLNYLASLAGNWDGYGGRPMAESVIALAEKLLNQLETEPMIYPVSDGSLQFEYDLKNEGYLELNLGLSQEIYMLLENGEEMEERRVSEKEAVDIVRKYCS